MSDVATITLFVFQMASEEILEHLPSKNFLDSMIMHEYTHIRPPHKPLFENPGYRPAQT